MVGGDESRSCLKVSHLLFANDTLIFSELDQDNLHFLRVLLLCFEVISGLRLIYPNQKLFMWVQSRIFMTWPTYRGVRFLLCFSVSLAFFAFGAPHKFVSIWNTVIGKVKRRLVDWKKLYLSIGH